MGNHISAKENDLDFSLSATVSYDQVRLLAALCATSDKMLFTADVRGAYLGVERQTGASCALASASAWIRASQRVAILPAHQSLPLRFARFGAQVVD